MWVLDAAAALQPAETTVVYGGELQPIAELPCKWVQQRVLNGSGSAAGCALPNCDSEQVLILSGDVPLISKETLQALLDKTPKDAVGMVTAKMQNPYGLGRIIRSSNGAIEKIVEEKDASTDEKQINEINAGIYLFPTNKLKKWLQQIDNKNSQQEYYLTDVIACAVKDKVTIYSEEAENEQEVQGINTREQLISLERYFQRKQAKNWLNKGVTISDPERIDIRGDTVFGQDVEIDVNTIFEGTNTIGNNVKIGPNTVIKNSVIKDGTIIYANSFIEETVIGGDCNVGPFARLRKGTVLEDSAKIGNFVETKNIRLGKNSKASHLSYLGDAEIGEKVNIGAGTITCNYDGVAKHKTIIKDDVFIGSDVQLVAPIVVEKGATIAAGTTLTKDAPAETLTLTKKQQHSIDGWKRPQKEKEVD